MDVRQRGQGKSEMANDLPRFDEIHQSCEAELAQVKALIQPCKDLLAIIHRDGGQHTEQHGLEQSVRDAHLIWAQQVAERDELAAQVATQWSVIKEVRRHIFAEPVSCEHIDIVTRDVSGDLHPAAKALLVEASLWRQVRCERCEGHGERMGVEYNGDTPEQVMVECIDCKGSGLKETKALLDRLEQAEMREERLVALVHQRIAACRMASSVDPVVMLEGLLAEIVILLDQFAIH